MEKTISINGYEFRVDFDYQPYERPTNCYPGCSEDADINDMWDSDGDEVKEYAFEFLEPLAKELCLEAVHDDQELAELERELAQYEDRL